MEDNKFGAQVFFQEAIGANAEEHFRKAGTDITRGADEQAGEHIKRGLDQVSLLLRQAPVYEKLTQLENARLQQLWNLKYGGELDEMGDPQEALLSAAEESEFNDLVRRGSTS